MNTSSICIMNSIIIYCLLLFVIYLGIVGLLVYYFFRARDIWNIFIDEIYQIFQNLVNGCSRHTTIGLFIPGFIYSSNPNSNNAVDGCSMCIECAREKEIQNANLYNVRILSDIHRLMNSLDSNILANVNILISSRCKMFQLLLEYIIRNYKNLYDADYKLYESLKLAYQNDISSSRIIKKQNKKSLEIEIIPLLEEYSSIFEKCYTICQNINIEMTDCTFLIAFYQDIKMFVSDARNNLLDYLE